ncbi:MAG TPA: VanZ family protein [Candidatus Woesebacteria bacterium]|nr:VanZ family protein [Candidatus Woesebacteria bacterium]
MKTIRGWIFYWGPPIIWIIIIFIMSSRQRISIADTQVENFIIFKTLHIIEYAFLYLLLFRANFKSFSKKISLNTIFTISIIGSILYAISDEVHQTFVPTRQGSIRDIGIDTIGILLAFSYTKMYLAKLRRFI